MDFSNSFKSSSRRHLLLSKIFKMFTTSWALCVSEETHRMQTGFHSFYSKIHIFFEECFSHLDPIFSKEITLWSFDLSKSCFLYILHTNRCCKVYSIKVGLESHTNGTVAHPAPNAWDPWSDTLSNRKKTPKHDK